MVSKFQEVKLPASLQERLENFHPEDFELPLEEFDDGRLSYYSLAQIDRQQRRIDTARNKIKKEIVLGKKCDKFKVVMQTRVDEDSISQMMNFGKSINLGSRKESLIGQRMRNVKKEALSELSLVKSVVGHDHGKLEDLSTKTVKDFEEESTIEFPRLQSVEEKLEDLRAEGYETWWRRRGRQIAARFSNEDKRMLRKWFQELDYDQSGEVSVVELQDPMLSAGIFKTREQIFRVMLNADKNDTMGLDFEEFLNALYNSKNKLIDVNKLKKLQAMGNDPNGIQMETLITAERRRKIINSILNQMEKREFEFDKSHDKYIRSGRKLDREKKRQKEEEAAMDMSRANSRDSEHHRAAPINQRGSVAMMTSPMKGPMTAAQRRQANKNNPIFKEHAKNTRNLKTLEVAHGDEIKLHDNYLNSLNVVLAQKREGDDRAMTQRLALVRESMSRGEDPSSVGGDMSSSTSSSSSSTQQYQDPLLQKGHCNPFGAYKRRESNPSMFGKNSRRAYQLSVEQADGKSHLNVLD
jgi:Ca2+-binding EF-hand superfamily protein